MSTGTVAAFRSIVGGRIKESIVFRIDSTFVAVAALVQIMLVNLVWSAAYASGTGTPQQSLETLLAYVTLAGLQSWLFTDSIVSFMQQRVDQGTFVFDLVRPVSFLKQMAAHQVGMTAGTALFLVPAIPLAYAVGTLQQPDNLGAALLYSLSTLLGLAVNVLLGLLMGVSAFWTFRIDGLSLLYRVVSHFFAGAIAPLSMFPGWLAGLAHVLPFSSTVYVPVSIYVGTLKGADAYQGMAVQAAWLVILTVMIRMVWRKAIRKVVVQGG
ncbi:ABC-2 family transporter protein [Streptomyces californicus]|uniref:ABC transporter permease n=1 Tax=Streptomyces californicus TaxID=67351 RepID=UPI00296FBF37|nr:ABC-2 family transporter protein [Streptomyces californicus]MDW4901636.1 ABC-2 family transporter protein [Streptomyces californicus]